MGLSPDIPEGRADEAAPPPAGEDCVALRARARIKGLCLFNMGCPAPQRPEHREAFAQAVAATLAALGLPPPAPDARIDIEDQGGISWPTPCCAPGRSSSRLRFTVRGVRR